MRARLVSGWVHLCVWSLLLALLAACDEQVCPTPAAAPPPPLLLAISAISPMPMKLDVDQAGTFTVHGVFDDHTTKDITERCHFELIDDLRVDYENLIRLEGRATVRGLANYTAGLNVDCNPEGGTLPQLTGRAWVQVERRPPTRFLYASDPESGNVGVFDLAAADHAAPVHVITDPAPSASPWRPDAMAAVGKQLFVLDAPAARVVAFALEASGAAHPILEFPVERGGAVTMTAGNGELYVGWADRTISAYDVRGRRTRSFQLTPELGALTDMTWLRADALLVLGAERDQWGALVVSENPTLFTTASPSHFVADVALGYVEPLRGAVGEARGIAWSDTYVHVAGSGGVARGEGNHLEAPPARDLGAQNGAYYLVADEAVHVYSSRASRRDRSIQQIAGSGSGFRARGSVVIADVAPLVVTPSPVFLDVGQQAALKVTEDTRAGVADVTSTCTFNLRGSPAERETGDAEDGRYIAVQGNTVSGVSSGVADVRVDCGGESTTVTVAVEKKPAERFVYSASEYYPDVSVFDPTGPSGAPPIRTITNPTPSESWDARQIVAAGADLYVLDAGRSRLLVLQVRSNGDVNFVREILHDSLADAVSLVVSGDHLITAHRSGGSASTLHVFDRATGAHLSLHTVSNIRVRNIAAANGHLALLGFSTLSNASEHVLQLVPLPLSGSAVPVLTRTLAGYPIDLAYDPEDDVLFVGDEGGIRGFKLASEIARTAVELAPPVLSIPVAHLTELVVKRGALYVGGGGVVRVYGKRSGFGAAVLNTFGSRPLNPSEGTSVAVVDEFAASFCGNASKETGEVCDGVDLGGATCAGQGLGTGTLACAPDCLSFDTTLCVPVAPTKKMIVSDFGAATISIFDATDNGDVSPKRTIAGANTLLAAPQQMVLSGSDLFVAEDSNKSILVFDVTVGGNVAPKRVIKGTATTLKRPSGIALVGSEIFLSDQTGPGILVFPISGDGDIAPSRTFVARSSSGPLISPLFLAVSPIANELLVADNYQAEVRGYDSSVASPSAPVRTFVTTQTPPTGNGPVGIATTGTEIYVACNGYSVGPTGDAVLVYAASAPATGATPTRVIAGASTLMSDARGVAVSSGEIFVTNAQAPAVRVYLTTDSGNVAPARSLVGANTGFVNPSGVLIADLP